MSQLDGSSSICSFLSYTPDIALSKKPPFLYKNSSRGNFIPHQTFLHHDFHKIPRSPLTVPKPIDRTPRTAYTNTPRRPPKTPSTSINPSPSVVHTKTSSSTLQRRDAHTTNPKQARTKPKRGTQRDPLAAHHVAKRRAPEKPTQQRGNGSDQAGADVELDHRLACRERVGSVRGQAVGKAHAGGVHAQREDEERDAGREAETEDADRVGDEGSLSDEEVDGGCAASVFVAWLEECFSQRGDGEEAGGCD